MTEEIVTENESDELVAIEATMLTLTVADHRRAQQAYDALAAWMTERSRKSSYPARRNRRRAVR